MEHTKLWVLYDNQFGKRDEDSYNEGDFTIPAENSVTGSEITYKYKGRMLDSSYEPPNERKFYPVYSYSSAGDKHSYSFKIPHGHHNLTQMKIRGCEHDSGSSGFQIHLHANADVIEEWVSYSPSSDITSFFIDEEDVNYPLWVWRCPFTELRIVLICSTKLKDPGVEFTLKRVDKPEEGKLHIPNDMQWICLKSGKVIVYDNGILVFGAEGENWEKKE